MNIYMKITYPDGDIEYWTLDGSIKELERLQKIHNNKLHVEFIEV